MARDLFKKVKISSKTNEGILELNDIQTNLIDLDDKDIQDIEKTKILDFNFNKKNPIFLENNIVREIQLLDHINYGCLPTRTDVLCWHDHNRFNTSPIGIPIEYVSKKDSVKECTPTHDVGCQDYFLTYGVFCSFPCALAYIHYHKEESLFKNSISLIHSLYYKMYREELKSNPAPHWQVLKDYGGHVDIKEFRSTYCTSNYVITENIKRPFMVAVGKYIEEKKVGCL